MKRGRGAEERRKKGEQDGDEEETSSSSVSSFQSFYPSNGTDLFPFPNRHYSDEIRNESLRNQQEVNKKNYKT